MRFEIAHRIGLWTGMQPLDMIVVRCQLSALLLMDTRDEAGVCLDWPAALRRAAGRDRLNSPRVEELNN